MEYYRKFHANINNVETEMNRIKGFLTEPEDELYRLNTTFHKIIHNLIIASFLNINKKTTSISSHWTFISGESKSCDLYIERCSKRKFPWLIISINRLNTANNLLLLRAVKSDKPHRGISMFWKAKKTCIIRNINFLINKILSIF